MMTSLKGSSSTRDDVNENFNSIPSPTDETESALEKEAFIRVTSGLAASAWGSDKYPDLPGSFCNTGTLGSGQQRGIHCPYKSAFDSVQVVQSSIDGANKDDKSYKRIQKVAKASYGDHGSHAKPPSHGKKRTKNTADDSKSEYGLNNDSILKKLTLNAKQNYKDVGLENTDGGNRISQPNNAKITQQNIKAAALTKQLESSSSVVTSQNHEQDDNPNSHNAGKHNNGDSDEIPVPNSPLAYTSLVQLSQHELQSNVLNDQRSSCLHATLADASLPATNDRSTPYPSFPNIQPERIERGICLTSPSKPASNNGLDNSEGNLIVHVNDIISVPKHSIEFHSTNINFFADTCSTVDFIVLELLGQGTFAQVFKCKHILSNDMIALKIVKNKPAYTRQAAIEIDVFKVLSPRSSMKVVREHHQQHFDEDMRHQKYTANEKEDSKMVKLLCHFPHHSHLCLVFELLGLNLYEVLKRRQFRGLPIGVVQRLVRQAIDGVKNLSIHSVVHCDLKPENILLVNDEAIKSIINAGDSSNTGEDDTEGNHNSEYKPDPSRSHTKQEIKLIDFGSACFEGHTAHTYIQSRFYRSPEVLVGLPYDGAIDMWSLGCVAAELFFGLPILPGIHEHDQLCRICEMISPIPDWMIEQGSKSKKYFRKNQRPSSKQDNECSSSKSVPPRNPSSSRTTSSTWKLKTRQDYVASLPENERRDKAKGDSQPNRYFKWKRLSEIDPSHGTFCQENEKGTLRLFIHFLIGILDPDPRKRWTAEQASAHPFVTGIPHRISREVYWVPPLPLSHRKLQAVKKYREKVDGNLRRVTAGSVSSLSSNNTNKQFHGVNVSDTPSLQETVVEVNVPVDLSGPSRLRRTANVSPEFSGTSRVTAMAESMSLSHVYSANGLPQHAGHGQVEASPPPSLGLPSTSSMLHQFHDPSGVTASLPLQTHVPTNLGQDPACYMHPLTPNQYTSNLSSMLPLGTSWVDPAYSTVVNVSQGHGDYSYQVPQVAPQSFSGVYYDRISQHLPVEGDLGYALQRPGVVPSMGLDQPGSLSQQHTFQYAPHLLTPNESSLSRSGHGVTSGVINMNTNSHLTSNIPSSLGIDGRGQYLSHQPQDVYDSSCTSDRDEVDRGVPSSVSSASRSLLAQQLEEHSAVEHVQTEASASINQVEKHIHSYRDVPNGLQNSQSLNQSLASPYQRQANLAYSNPPGSLGSTISHHGAYYSVQTSGGPSVLMSNPSTGIDPRMVSYHANGGQYAGSYGRLDAAHPTLLHPHSYQMQNQVIGHCPPYPVIDDRVYYQSYCGDIGYNGNYTHDSNTHISGQKGTQ